MSRAKLPIWPRPACIAHDNITAGTVNLSTLSAEQKAAAFQRLKENEPGIAEFVTRMARSFGRSELLVDSETAKRLGVKR